MGPVARICASICWARVSSGTGTDHGVGDKGEPSDQHGQTQDLAHGEPRGAEEVAELLIGQADKFDEDTAQRIADAEDAGDESGAFQPTEPAGADEDDHEQQQAFEPGLVELARMPRQRFRVGGEDDGPGKTGRRAIQLAIDEICEADEKNSDRADGAQQIEARQYIAALGAREQPHGDDDADEPAVKAHAAVPKGDDVARVLAVIGEVVKEYVAQAAPQNDADHGPESEIP